jgi:hypothetical protein
MGAKVVQMSEKQKSFFDFFRVQPTFMEQSYIKVRQMNGKTKFICGFPEYSLPSWSKAT